MTCSIDIPSPERLPRPHEVMAGLDRLRQSRLVVTAVLALILLLYAATYLIGISPLFDVADEDNAAIRRSLASDSYAQVIGPVARELAAYSSGHGPPPLPSRYLIEETTQWGLVVIVHVALVQIDTTPLAETARSPAYKLRSSYDIRLSWPDLIWFGVIELAIAIVLVVFRRNQPTIR